MKVGNRTYLLCLILLFVSSCVPTPAPGPSQVTIIYPHSGAVLPLSPVNLKFEGASFVGITTFEVRVDGALQASVPPLSTGSCGPNCGTKFYAESVWKPPGAGTYTINVRAFGNVGGSSEAEIEITIAKYLTEDTGPLPLKPSPTPPGVYLPLPIPNHEGKDNDTQPTSTPAGRP